MPESETPLVFTTDHPSLSIDHSKLHALLLSICEIEGYQIEELSVVFTTHEAVRKINVAYLNHDYNTDVVAFQFTPSDVTRMIDGEIYVDLDMAQERCYEFEASFEEEASRYVIHGLLHLMNYSDKTEEARKVMKERETAYLKSLTET